MSFGLGRGPQVVRVGVTVTFLRMSLAPGDMIGVLPDGARVERVTAPTVGYYRYLYNTVGADYVWWLRRTMPDVELGSLLRHPGVSIHVLMLGGEPAGFYELDRRHRPDINLNYFGLMPHVVGTGVGYRLLCHAVAEAWASLPRGMTVNTCTADHPRALPSYLRVGFVPFRRSDEVWDVPVSLGLKIPDRLRL